MSADMMAGVRAALKVVSTVVLRVDLLAGLKVGYSVA